MANLMARSVTVAVAFVVAGVFVAGCERDPAKDAPITSANSPAIANPPATLSGPEGGATEEFTKRINEYIALHKQLDGTLKRLPENATPLQIDAHQRALAALIAKARADKTVGAIFAPPMQVFIRGLIQSVIKGSNGGTIKASLMDENPMGAKVEINGRYPDTVPLSTMPPEVLSALPKLPPELEYRFVGNRLILLDTPAHIIVDFVADTFDIGK